MDYEGQINRLKEDLKKRDDTIQNLKEKVDGADSQLKNMDYENKAKERDLKDYLEKNIKLSEELVKVGSPKDRASTTTTLGSKRCGSCLRIADTT